MNTQAIFSQLRGRIGIAPQVACTGKLAGLRTHAGKCRANADLPTAPTLTALLQRRPAADARLRHGAALRAIALAAAFAGTVATPIVAGVAAPTTGRIGFYGGILDLDSVNSSTPLVVRPSQVLLAEDGSVALVDLRWSDWGTSVARATGVWSASDCTPSCADGKLTKRPAQLTLSNPGLVLGHMVYRCYQVDPPNPQRDPADHGCLRRDGTYQL